jgi:hypothetical protein
MEESRQKVLPTEDKRKWRNQVEGLAYRGQERMEESRQNDLPIEDKREWRKSGRRSCLQRIREN